MPPCRLTTWPLLLTLVGVSACSDEGAITAKPGADAGADSSTSPSADLPNAWPVAAGTCPGFVDGERCHADGDSLLCTFEPAGGGEREARFWFDDVARETQSPLVFYFHGLTRASADGASMLNASAEDRATGAILVAPERTPGREPPTSPWFTAPGTQENDLLLMDEIVACADTVLDLDPRRVHVTGMSAGGLMTSRAGPERSNYVASIASMSGGSETEPVFQDPTNKFGAIFFHGGDNDQILGSVFFKTPTITLRNRLEDAGHFTLLCDHGGGHTQTAEESIGAWRFMMDHPYRADPSPYADELPEAIPAYCVR